MKNNKIYHFGSNIDSSLLKDLTFDQEKELLGGKGACLREISKINNVNVPDGFTITTQQCREFFSNDRKLSEDLKNEVRKAVGVIEKSSGKKFGSITNPLLVSVRSGACVSMPGMMDTILNLGLCKESVKVFAKEINEKFALDCYRRFIQMYGEVVLGIYPYKFQDVLNDIKSTFGIKKDNDFEIDHLKKIIDLYQNILSSNVKSMPEDPYEQLFCAIESVFESWINERASVYRKIYNISVDLGTAVNIQSMVFGNKDNDSLSGVMFTRNPVTGEKEIYGEYLVNSQGEDIVSGVVNPLPLSIKSCSDHSCNIEESMEKKLPDMFAQLSKVASLLENHYRDMQDIEFTVESGKLWILQSRNGKRSVHAGVEIAYDMYQGKVISKEEAIMSIDAERLHNLLHPHPVEGQDYEVIASGLPASPGVSVGMIALSVSCAEKYHKSGKDVILVRHETSPEDVYGMNISKGILTSKGGMTSHAAVVARGMGVPCVVGCEDIQVDYSNSCIRVDEKEFKEGELITINGATGEVISGSVEMENSKLPDNFIKILSWLDDYSAISIRANAETLKDCRNSIKFGAHGIGLCRTEHMFFDQERINIFRKLILAEEDEREALCGKLGVMQQSDFLDLFKELNGLPVNIRLLDPPLHEFLPKSESEINDFAKLVKLPKDVIVRSLSKFEESNPMLGLRGVRLGIVRSDIYNMQIRAIFSAYVAAKQDNYDVKLEIMLPLVVDVNEVKFIKKSIIDIAEELEASSGIKIEYLIGSMIEAPRACFMADKIASEVSYFSFGTNDLTQMSYGISRDDYDKFIKFYKANDIMKLDPFIYFDAEGVGQLISIACQKSRKIDPHFKIGVCGEHAGHKSGIKFFMSQKIDYVSCSPYRIPVAKFLIAQESIGRDK